MKVLLLTENFPPRRGGMAQACDRIVNNLRHSSIEVDVANFSGCRPIKVIQQQNGKLFVIPINEGPGHSLNCFWNLLKSPKTPGGYSHIIAFGGYLPMLALPIFKEWLGCCAVSMLRGNEFDLGIFAANRRSILFDAFYSSNAISVLSNDQLEKLLPFTEPEKVFLIPNGLDCKNWKTDPSDLTTAKNWRQQNINETKLVIGLIGQLKAKKGGQFFLSNLLSANLAEKCHLLLIGDISQELTDWLEEKNDRLNFSRLPFLDRWELLRWYPACDFIALPSFYDGMPNVLLEAGALEIPVIAAQAGGIPDVVCDDSMGVTFFPGDRHECREALWKAISSNDEQRKKWGQNLKNRINLKFNADRETRNYVKLLKYASKTKPIGFMK